MWVESRRRSGKRRVVPDGLCAWPSLKPDMFCGSVVPRFSLVFDRQNQDAVVCFFVAVERDVSGTAPRDHEFPQNRVDRPADFRVALQNADGFGDKFGCLECFGGIGFKQKVTQSLKIVQRLNGVD